MTLIGYLVPAVHKICYFILIAIVYHIILKITYQVSTLETIDKKLVVFELEFNLYLTLDVMEITDFLGFVEHLKREINSFEMVLLSKRECI